MAKKTAVALAMSKDSSGLAPKDAGKKEAAKAPESDGRIVTQADIKTVCDMDAEVKRRRAEIEAKVREGWKVEGGVYFARVEQSMTKEGCTKKWLTAQLGAEVAEGLWAKLGQKSSERFRYGFAADKGEPVGE